MKINYYHTKPPNWDTLIKYFPANWDNVIVTYGDGVYSKNDINIIEKIHEAVHVNQQAKMGAEAWWEEYYVNPTFRFAQELEAYREQADAIRMYVKDRNLQFQMLRQICHYLSSDVYGNLVSYEKARELLL